MFLWVLRMAWRDSRRQRAKLLLFGCSMALGAAALAGLGSLRKNLQSGIEEQSRALVGADLVLSSPEPFDRDQEDLFRSLGGTQARDTRFSSMLYFESSGQSRLVQARVVTGDFPFYGRFETTPPSAGQEFADGRGALIEQSLLLQYGGRPGEAVRVGDLRSKIAGSLDKAPGESLVVSTLAPRVYVKRPVGSTNLDFKPGSLASYRVYFRFPAGRGVEELVRRKQGRFDQLRLGVETVARRKRQLGRAFDELDDFMSLIALIALALGGLGISSALSVHLREKRTTAAVLRCLGCSFRRVAGIYLVQSLALGAAGVAAGVLLGIGAQLVLPRVLAGFLPVEARFAIEWLALLQAAGYGLGLAAAFGLLPLLEIRQATPLAAIRRSFESRPENAADPAKILIWLLIAGALAAFCALHAPRWREGIGMALGLMGVIGVLAGISRFLVWLVRRMKMARWPFVARQGMANLHRPRNRTLLLTVVLGMGTALWLTVHLTQTSLLAEFKAGSVSSRGNTVLMDVQKDQVAGLTKLLKEQGLPLVDHAPIVTMRLVAVKGVAVEANRGGQRPGGSGWARRREYRSTYSASLREGEKLTAGQWPPVWNTNDAVVPVSLEEGIARDLGVQLGDSLDFDIQGIPVLTRVAALRQVEWRQVRPNFFIVFPPGAIDDAPAFDVFVTRTESAAQSAAFQKSVFLRFPNISVIDLRTIMEAVEAIIAKAEQVVRFISGFTLLAALVVLAGALATSRTQRIRESALLRALGASKRQLLQILAVEYAALGALAGMAGTLLAVAAAWAVCRYALKFPFAPDWILAPFIWMGSAALAVLAGLLGAGKILDHPPLEVLRSEE